MSSSLNVVLTLSFLVYLRTAVQGLLCHCDLCKDANYTCPTDGVCFASATLNKETGDVVYAYRCFEKELAHPYENPIMCHSNSKHNDSFVISCCRNYDFCNRELSPSLHVRKGPDL